MPSSVQAPERSAPRHWGQSSAAAGTVKVNPSTTPRERIAIAFTVGNLLLATPAVRRARLWNGSATLPAATRPQRQPQSDMRRPPAHPRGRPEASRRRPLAGPAFARIRCRSTARTRADAAARPPPGTRSRACTRCGSRSRPSSKTPPACQELMVLLERVEGLVQRRRRGRHALALLRRQIVDVDVERAARIDLVLGCRRSRPSAAPRRRGTGCRPGRGNGTRSALAFGDGEYIGIRTARAPVCAASRRG